jgi:hypothetical protein
MFPVVAMELSDAILRFIKRWYWGHGTLVTQYIHEMRYLSSSPG